MKIRLQVELLGRLVIGLFAFTVAISVQADSSAADRVFSIELPEINTLVEIKLENLFRGSHLEQEEGNPDQDSPDPVLNQPIQLVGTLIMPDSKIAWIKTGEFQIHVLTEKQLIPGSQLQINRIVTDSVELVNISKCQKNADCRPDLKLDLN